MTSTADLPKRVHVEHRVFSHGHDPKVPSYGLKTTEKFDLDPQRVLKAPPATMEEDELLAAVVPAIGSLDLKALTHAAGTKKADVVDPQAAQRVVGYLVDGISPLGQKKRLRTSIDESTQQYSGIHVSARRRGLEAELAVGVLAQLTQGPSAAIGRG